MNFLAEIIDNPDLHARLINTLSYLENCGARKIAACEHPTLVKEEMLKHASEEFRHAHYLKKQIARVVPYDIEDYSLPTLLGGLSTLHYLDRLDLFVCKKGVSRPAAYLLVTYAIECRAAGFYPLYEASLRAAQSKVTVKSILLEEQEHLQEMRTGIEILPNGWTLAKEVLDFERELYERWCKNVLISLSERVLITS